MTSEALSPLGTTTPPPVRTRDGCPGVRLPLTAFIAFTLTVLGAAGSVAVMGGIIGVPTSAAGIAMTAILAPTLVRPGFGKIRQASARALAFLAALASGLCSMAFASTAATSLLAATRAPLPAQASALGSAIGAHWLLWSLSVALGLLAIGTARGRNAIRDLDAVVLWAAYAPATVLALEWLYRHSLIALTA